MFNVRLFAAPTMPARLLPFFIVFAAAGLGACATANGPSGLTTTPRPSAPMLAPSRAAQPPVETPQAATPQSSPRFVYRGGKEGTYAPSPYWTGHGQAPQAAAPQQPHRYYDPVPQPVAAASAPAYVPAPQPARRPAFAQPSAAPVAAPPQAQGPAPVQMINGQRVVEVRSGDTLFSIARQQRVSMSGLMQANRLASVKLMPGQRLVLPRS